MWLQGPNGIPETGRRIMAHFTTSDGLSALFWPMKVRGLPIPLPGGINADHGAFRLFTPANLENVRLIKMDYRGAGAIQL